MPSHTLSQGQDFSVEPNDKVKNVDSVSSESRSRLSLDILNSKSTDGGMAGTLRASSVLAGGLMDGMVNGTSHALENKVQTATTVAESFLVGYGLSAMSKMGKMGGKAAVVAGVGMGAAWVYSEFTAGRPQATFSAVSDAFHSGSHMDANRKAVANNGGAILFEATLAGVAGGAGMKMGMGGRFAVKENWHVDALAAGKAKLSTATDFLGRDNLPGLSRSFAGKESGPKGDAIFDQVKELVSTKPKAAGSFADLQAHLEKSKLADDATIVGLKSKLTEVHTENIALAGKETQLSSKITKQIQEKESLSGPLPEKTQLTRAQENLKSTEDIARTVESRRRDHDRLFREKEEARTNIKEATNPGGGPSAEKLAFDAKNQEFRNAKAAFEEAKSMGGPEAVSRARQRVTEAEQALTAAELAKPGKIAALDEQIKATEVELNAVRDQRKALTTNAQDLVKSHESRMGELLADPTKLVKVEKPVVIKAEPQGKAVADALANKILTADQPVVSSVAEVKAIPEVKAVPEVKAIPEVKAVPEVKIAAEIKVAPEVQPVIEVKQPVKALDLPETEVGQAKVETRIEAPATEVKLSASLEQARSSAHAIVEANKLSREVEVNKKTIADIDGNIYKARPGEVIADTRARAEQNMTRAQAELGSERGPSYTRALKVVSQYARAVSKELAQTADSGKRGQIATQAVSELEGMMNGLPNSYKGFHDKLGELREPGRGINNGSPEKRLADIQEHLEAKTRLLDGNRNKQLEDMAAQQPILKEILQRQADGTLPEDGTIVLFGQNGKYLNHPNTRSPHFIEVSRLNEHGVGADGAGFNRFAQNLADIQGMVVLKPIYENGVKVQLNKGPNASGKPVFKKMVADVFGHVPDEIKVNDNFVKILDRFGPERQGHR